MDKNVFWVNEKKIDRTIKALKRNNMNGFYVKDRQEFLSKIEQLLKKDSVVSCGGSATLEQAGVLKYLRSGRYKFLDRAQEGITPERKKQIHRETFFADAFFTSVNALTEEGELFNVDGTGNRVAAMLFGPDKVIVVCGVNKIVRNLEEAIERNKRVAAPANARRLNCATPCTTTGCCTDCISKNRICNEYTFIRNQLDDSRIYVFIFNENLGY
ncbi:lactate utilization protein [Clostridium sp.]|uniref:lactate utilization protein n=1 Tax=Clostridium sp. TaxID=1506 RepID=UPI002FDD8D78